MAVTFKQIATVTVSTATQAEIEFTSIPGTYTDLLVKLSTRVTTGATENDNIQMTFNNATTNRTEREIFGNGSTAGSASISDMRAGYTSAADATASTFGSSEVYIPNYAGSTNKSASTDGAAEGNITGLLMGLHANLWSQTNAITSIKFYPAGAGASFTQYSTATLYGISNS